MFTKKGLLCIVVIWLAIGGIAGIAGATNFYQDDFEKTINGTPTKGLTYVGATGSVIIPTGVHGLGGAVNISGNSSTTGGNFSITIGNGTDFTVEGFHDDNPSVTGGIGYLNVTGLTITGGKLTVTASANIQLQYGSAGLIVHNSLVHSGGIVELKGGSEDNDIAMGLVGAYQISGGELYTQGGTGSSSIGLLVGNGDNSYTGSRDFIQTGGSVYATGGSDYSEGIWVAGQVNISNGYMQSTGGAGTDAHGIEVSNSIDGRMASFIQSGGTVVATGSDTSTTGHGILIYDMADTSGDMATYEMHGGTLTAAGKMASGLVIIDDVGKASFNQYAGTVNAVGSTEGSAHGIVVADAYNMYGGTLNATGGELTNTGFAVGLGTENFTQTSGVVSAYGGEGTNQTGNSNYTAGIRSNIFMQDGGVTRAYGGTGTKAYGIYTDNFTQNAGYFNAYGGSGDNAYGLYVSGAAESTIAGNFYAISGDVATAYGAYFTGNLTLNAFGRLEFAKSDSLSAASSIMVNGDFIASAGSTISPVINLSGAGTVGALKVEGNVTFDDTGSGVTFKPWFANVLDDDRSTKFTTSEAFIISNSGTITGDFNNVTPGNTYRTLFYDYTIVIDADQNYAITNVTQTTSIASALSTLSENTQSLMNGIVSGVIEANANNVNTQALSLLSDIFDTLVNSQDMAEFKASASSAQLHLTNHGGTRLAAYNMQQLDVVQMAMNREIANAQKLPYWQIWTKGVFHSGDVDAKTHEFVDGDEDFSGIVIGAARDFRYMTFAGQAHYLTGKVKSKNYYKADADNFGFIAGLRIHDVVNPKAVFNPWFDVNFAYSHMNADQKRLTLGYDYASNITTTSATSDAKSNLFRIGMAMGNTFKMGDIGTVTPQIGFDYTNIKFDGYTERSAGMALKTGKTTYESLRPKMGAEAEVYISDYITANVRAFYYYETMDQRMNYTNSFAGAEMVRFKTKGEKFSRSSANIGTGLNMLFTEQVSAGLAYDMWLRDKYMAHQFAVELRVNF